MAERIFTKTILPSKLYEELIAVIPEIFVGVQYRNPTVTIVLTEEPTATQDETINQIVNNHVPSRKNYLIWNLVQDPMAKHIAPMDVDFDLLPLAIKRTYNRGEEDVITYYKTATINPDGSLTFIEPVLRATWTWTNDPLNFPVYAEEKIEWYYEDGSVGPAFKIVPHFFDGLHKIQKGIEARSIQVADLQLPVSEMIIYNETVRRATEEGNPDYTLTLEEMEAAVQIGRKFLTDYQTDFNAYTQHRDFKILTTLANANDAFLDWVNPYNPPQTIREFILSDLTPPT